MMSLNHVAKYGRKVNILNIRLDEKAKEFAVGLVVFALIKPDSLSYIGLGWLDGALMLLDVAMLAILGVLFVGGKIRFNPISVSIVCMWLCLCTSTVLYSRDYLQLLKTAGPATCACLFTDYLMRKDPDLFLGAWAKALAILYTINAITIVAYYPAGMYSTDWVTGDCYFMGFDNGMIYGLLPMCVYSLCYCRLVKGNLFAPLSYYCLALAVFSVCYVQTATGVIAMGILVLLLCVRARSIDGSALVKPGFLIAFYFIVTLLLVVFRVQTYFSVIISDLFNKDVTLSGRTFLWDYALQLISQRPFIGYGATTRAILGTNGHVYPHPHCLVLDMLYRGGIPMFIAFLAMFVSFSHAYKNACGGFIRDAILIGAFALLVVEITGSTQFKPLFYGVFALMNYASLIERMSAQRDVVEDLDEFPAIKGGRA